MEELLAHDGQLRALARRLLEDEDDADDLIQEAYLSALERGAHSPRAPSRWWREFLRLKARTLRHQESRRKRREVVVATPEGKPDELVTEEDREAFLHALARAVDELDEPYRTTMQMRFVEEIPPREIARRERVPVTTVYTRVNRGLKQLRGRMDRNFDDRSWMVIALALPRRHAKRAPKLVALGAAGLLTVIAPWLVLGDTAPSRTQRSSAAAVRGLEVSNVPEGEQASPSQASPDTAIRRRVLSSSAGSAPVVGTVPEAPMFSGRVVDPEGAVLSGIPVVAEPGKITSPQASLGNWVFAVTGPPDTETVSGSDGSFELDIPSGFNGRVLARGAGYRPVLAEAVPFAGRAHTLELVAAPVRSVVGRVVDPEGDGLADVSLHMRSSPEFTASQRRPERSWVPVMSEARSDAHGYFELEDAYVMVRSRIEVQKEGFVPQQLNLVVEGPLELEIELEPLPPRSLPIRGFVVDENGAWIEDAVVAAARGVAVTDEGGGFQLDTDEMGESETLWVLVEQKHPVTIELVRDGDGRFYLPDPFVIEVVDPPLVIEGRIVDADGDPVSGAYVWCHDMTKVGTSRSSLFAEDIIDPADWNVPYDTGTEEDGSFRIPYLMDREYRIGSVYLPTLDSVLGDPVPAGTRDLILTLPTDQAHSTVTGRVITKGGRPVEGATVALVSETVRIPIEPGFTFTSEMRLRSTSTDADGRFELGDLPGAGYSLTVKGDDFVQNGTPIPASTGAEPRQIVITVARRAHLRLARSLCCETATHYSLFDGSGKRLTVYAAEEFDRNFDMSPYVRVGITDGGSAIIVSPDTATEIVFYEDEVELSRLPIQLSADMLNELSL